jgi:hypothetical protein
MAEKSLVNDVAVTEPDDVLPPTVVPVVFVDEELLHATSPTAMPRDVAARAARLRETSTDSPLVVCTESCQGSAEESEAPERGCAGDGSTLARR